MSGQKSIVSILNRQIETKSFKNCYIFQGPSGTGKTTLARIFANKINNDKMKSEDKKHVMIIADEFHLFIDENNFEVLRNFGQLARRIRKYSGSLVVATQSVKDFVGSNAILRHSTAIFNNCQYQMIGMLKEDDLLAYLELFKQNPLTDTQKNFLMSARRGEFLLNIDSKNRLRIWIRATELEREMMGESDTK